MMASASFPRRTEALQAIFAFTADFWQREAVAAELHLAIDFVLEELFTNIVKYGTGSADVVIALRAVPGGIEAEIDEPEARRFDPTLAPEVDTTLPAARRQPGGLGLHLIRRMVDSIDYRYSESDRHGRVTFRKTTTEGRHAGD
jgi:anti-sigma regulatory factor (Ser/Thr protein kinase)